MKIFLGVSTLFLFFLSFLSLAAIGQRAPYFPEGVSSPQHITQIKDIFYFSANHFRECSSAYDDTCITYTLGYQLWRSDGTEEGTSKIADYIYDTSIEEDFITFPDAFLLVDTSLYFIGQRTYSSFDLCKIDNNMAFPQVVKTMFGLSDPLEVESYNYHFTAFNGMLLFTAGDDYGAQITSYGVELWRSDGTEEGTVMVKDIFAGIQGSYPADIKTENGLAFFTATDEAGRELWQTDGFEEGTKKVSKGISKRHIPGEGVKMRYGSIEAYPNPFEDKITLSLIKEQGQVQIMLTDMVGNVYYQAEGFISNQSEQLQLQLDLSAIAIKSGMYFLSIKGESGKGQAVRIVKR